MDSSTTDDAAGSAGGAPPPSSARTAPSPPPPPSGPRALTRSASDRVIAGVSGGLGEYLRIDPLFIRIGFVLLSFAGGIGLLLYVVGWALIPEAGSRRGSRLDGLARWRGGRARGLFGGILVVIAVMIVASSLHLAHEGLLWGLALLGVGIFLLVRERWEPAPARADMSAPLPSYAGAYPATAGPAWVAATPPRPRSILGLVTVAAALLAVGVAALLDAAGVISLSLATGTGIALVVIGAGLVAGTWFGRSRLLIVLGILLIPVAGAATLVREPLIGGTGNRIVAPQALRGVQSDYHLAAGQLTLDLRQVSFAGPGTSVSATVALGQLTVVVPAAVTVDVRAHTGAGQIDILGHVDDGINIDSATTSPPGGTSTLHLDLSVGLGQVRVVIDPGGGNVPGAQ